MNLSASSKPRSKSKRRHLPVAHPDAAGIDIGSAEHFVAVPQDRDKESVRKFGAFTQELDEMAGWLKACGITTVAMESTGSFWIPVYERLEEAGFEVLLVDARSVKNVPGRKTDVLDCQWIQQLHTYGLLRAAFRPAAQIRAIRTYQRHRKNQVELAGQHVQHIQKMLVEVNLQLPLVLSNVVGESGQRILDAILAGERNPKVLAGLADFRVKKSRAEIEAALTGNYRQEALDVIAQSLEAYRFYAAQIEKCEQKLLVALSQLPSCPKEETAPTSAKTCPTEGSTGKPHQANRKRTPQEEALWNELKRVIGVDLTCLPGLAVVAVLTLLSEIGTDMTRWRNAKAFSSWLGLCPNHRISGGKILSANTRKVVSRAATILRMAALNCARSDTTLGSFYRRKRAQFGPAKAVTATARKIACLIYTLMSKRQPYENPDVHVYEFNFRKHRIASLKKQAEDLGFSITELPKAA